jgi:hypothetical protein
MDGNEKYLWWEWMKLAQVRAYWRVTVPFVFNEQGLLHESQ